MAKVDLEQVVKIYPGSKEQTVKGIDLSIRDREFVVLVGPSGCGKSTTLRMIAGLEEITGGAIRIGERVVNDVPPKDRDIAMVFQNYALYPHMSVYKNMAFGLKLRRVPKDQIDRRVREAAKILDITHLLERKPKQLSGGQRQRVAVGRAIVREPAAFLFDEPLSNLDAKLRVTTRAEIKRLHQRLKTTTIYVTHDQEEAMTLGDRIVVMKDGVIRQADTPLQTYSNPADRFVAGFIGMPPMNFFDGSLRVDRDGAMWFEEGVLKNARATGAAAAKMAKGTEVDEPVVLTGELTLPGNGFTLPVPERLRDRLMDKIGQHVVLGVRPEHLHLQPDGTGAGDRRAGRTLAPIQVSVGVVEPLGKEMDVYLKTPLHDHVVARIEATHGLAQSSQGTAYVDVAKVHVFEPGETGLNLTRENGEVSPHNEQAHAVA